VDVASLAPNQHHCNLKLRVLSVEAIAETVHPETGKVIQSAEAIVGDDTACILLNLKNGKYQFLIDISHLRMPVRLNKIFTFGLCRHEIDQVNLLARNARLQLLNAHVNMYRGFMCLEVNEDDEGRDEFEYEGQCRPSITTIVGEEDDSIGQRHELCRSDNKSEETTTSTSTTTAENHSRTVASSLTTVSPASQQPLNNASTSLATIAAASSSVSTSTAASRPLSTSQSSTSSLPSTLSRDQLEVEMRLGSGGSVPLMEYYRMAEFTYFSTVEPVGR
ncbi:hypothetical protein BGZ51_009070, partial [Haplosporangium sp. Z 767]